MAAEKLENREAFVRGWSPWAIPAALVVVGLLLVSLSPPVLPVALSPVLAATGGLLLVMIWQVAASRPLRAEFDERGVRLVYFRGKVETMDWAEVKKVNIVRRGEMVSAHVHLKKGRMIHLGVNVSENIRNLAIQEIKSRAGGTVVEEF
jgi:hypothetical protein